MRTAFSVVAVAMLLFVAGCSPVTLSVTLGEDPGRLWDAPVIKEPGSQGHVVLIDVRGLIADATPEGLGAVLWPAGNPVDELANRLERAAKDSSVKAVVLRINSPGGTVTASDMMYREVRRFAATTKKPVVASLGEVAASGGYYLALSADEIVTEPTCVTGSIGVIIPTINVSEGLGRIGIRARNVKSGANKDMGDPLTPPVERHYDLLQALVDDYYGRFRGLVVERRSGKGMNVEQLDDLADGRVMSGVRAVQAGLADSEGGIHEAFAAAKRRAGIEHGTLVKYYSKGPRPRTPYAAGPAVSGGGGEAEINLMQVRMDSGGLGRGANAYYLWVP